MHCNIQYMFDCSADPLAHLHLLLKSSIPLPFSDTQSNINVGSQTSNFKMSCQKYDLFLLTNLLNFY